MHLQEEVRAALSDVGNNGWVVVSTCMLGLSIIPSPYRSDKQGCAMKV
jgi:hypothetical protein